MSSPTLCVELDAPLEPPQPMLKMLIASVYHLSDIRAIYWSRRTNPSRRTDGTNDNLCFATFDEPAYTSKRMLKGPRTQQLQLGKWLHWVGRKTLTNKERWEGMFSFRVLSWSF
eukprot:2983150-Pyramimonas_sp.AAC.1